MREIKTIMELCKTIEKKRLTPNSNLFDKQLVN